MAELSRTINPNLQTNLRDQLAQGANVGDIAQGTDGGKYRWSGVRWEREHTSQPSFSNQVSSVSRPQPVQTSFEDIVKRTQELARKAAKPFISSLQASIPETSKKFATEKARLQGQIDPLKERFKNLLDEIKGQGQKQETAQTRVTAQELGKRGLLSSSTLAQQELVNAVQPIQEQTQRLTKETGLAQEQGIKAIQDQVSGLLPQETEALRNIKNAIAQLQSQGLTNATSTALQILSQQERAREVDIDAKLRQAGLDATAEQNRIANELAKQKIDLSQKQAGLAERQFQEVTLPIAQRQINKPYYKPTTSSSNDEQTVLQDIFGGGTKQVSPPSYFKPEVQSRRNVSSFRGFA